MNVARSCLTIAILSAIALFPGCTGEKGPAGPVLTGSLTGFIVLNDEYGSDKFDHSGATVAISELNLSTISDSLGKWTIEGLTTGTYTLIINKIGYGGYVVYGLPFAGGGADYYGKRSLYELPSYYPVAVTLDSVDTDYIHITAALSAPGEKGKRRSLVYFVGETPDVNYSPDKYVLDDAYISFKADTALTKARIYTEDLELKGLKGKTVYVIAYASSYPQYNNYYTDIHTGKKIYCSLHPQPSNVLAVPLPD